MRRLTFQVHLRFIFQAILKVSTELFQARQNSTPMMFQLQKLILLFPEVQPLMSNLLSRYSQMRVETVWSIIKGRPQPLILRPAEIRRLYANKQREEVSTKSVWYLKVKR